MINQRTELNHKQFNSILFGLYAVFSAAKLILIPFDVLRGLGDITHFYNLAQIPGLPFINYWSEFPPISVYLFELFYWVSKENFQWFTFLFLTFMTVINFGNIVVFAKIMTCFPNFSEQNKKNLLFFFLLVMIFLPYTWWYFDGLTLFLLLVGFYTFINKSVYRSIYFIAAGVLTKLFPVLLLVVYLKAKYPLRKMIKVLLLFGIMVIVPYLILFYFSPAMTKASVVSQAAKGSWETVWALIDGNYQTGNFGPLWERLDPELAYKQIGNDAVINQKITIVIFGVIGLFAIWRKRIKTPQQYAQLILFTFCVFFLWSAGWSPQWIIYILPFLLLSIASTRNSVLFSVFFIMLNLAEWPILIGLQLLALLPITIILRTAGFFIFAVYLFFLMDQESKSLG